MMPTILSFLSGRQITNDSGVPQTGAKVYHYRATTTTNLTVWQNSGATVPHAQPVVCDAGGFVPLVYVDDTFDWKIVVTTSADVTLPQYNFDNLTKAESDASGGGFALLLLDWTQVTSAGSPVALLPADAGKGYEGDTTGGNITFNLPSAASVGNGKGFCFKKTGGANSLILASSGTELIEGSASDYTIGFFNQSIYVISNGANWLAFAIVGDPIADARLPAAAIAIVGVANGLTIVNNTATPTTQLDIACSEAVLLTTAALGLRVGAQALTLNAASVGANGIDTGALANNTWYHVWLISNGTTTACLLSLSATAPTMPSGYTFKYRIGAQRTGGAATFNRVLQKGNRAQYVVVAASVTPNLPIMTSGVAGNVNTPTWVAVATGSFLPPTAPIIKISGTDLAAGSVILAPNNSYGARTSTTNPPFAVFGNFVGGLMDMTLESTNIFWASADAQSVLTCVGWIDSVNAS